MIAEIVYVFLPVLVSTAFALPPFIVHEDSFGIAGPWCFARSLDKNCKRLGFAIQMTFYGMYLSLGVAGIVASVLCSYT